MAIPHKKTKKGKVSRRKVYAAYILKNILFLIIAGCVVGYAVSKQPAYHWTCFRMLKSNMETIKKHPKLTFEQKMQMKLGTSYAYLLFLKQSTPEDAVILYPDSKDFRIEGSPFTHEIYNKIYATRFLYPRKIILAGELATGKYAGKITHVAVVNGKGADRLPYPVDPKVQHGIYPMKPPTK
jgi:hypothetical protein